MILAFLAILVALIPEQSEEYGVPVSKIVVLSLLALKYESFSNTNYA
jgi:hypothetical protein